METFKGIIEELIAREGSERKLAMLLGVSNTAVNGWRSGNSFPGEERVMQIAELVKRDPAYMLALVERDRAKSKDSQQVWARVAERMKGAAMVAGLAFAAAASGGFNNNVFAGNSTPASSSESGHKYTLRRYQRRRAVLGVAL